MKQVLVTGGAGYIGSHICLKLVETGYKPIVIDNYSNSCPESIKRVEKLVKTAIIQHRVDLKNKQELLQIINRYKFDACIHLAGLKTANESIYNPLKYYNNNVLGSINLLQTLQEVNCKVFVFSSSATVYGTPKSSPISENAPTGNTNSAYGTSKYMVERMMQDLQHTNNNWKIGILRYFNPIGAHSSGEIGEDPNEIPNNLMPFISQVAAGKLKRLKIFGNNYSTIDGTGIRDYIHVVDLAEAHIKMLKYLLDKCEDELQIINLGTGKGTSVLELVSAFEKSNQIKIPYEIVAKRLGDIATCYASSVKAKKIINWQAKLDIETMCKDTWRWQSRNPNGYNR